MSSAYLSNKVWALQSRTQHIPLGFAPSVKLQGGKEITEHQFMHVGWGVHVKHLQELFAKSGVSYQSAYGFRFTGLKTSTDEDRVAEAQPEPRKRLNQRAAA